MPARQLSQKELHAKLSGFGLWDERPFALNPVIGGLTNSNWRVDVEGDPVPYFVKVPGPGTEKFIDWKTVAAAAKYASEIGVGPNVYHRDEETGIEVSEFLEGYQPCTAWEVGLPDICAELMGLLHRWNSGPVLPQTKTVFEMVDEHRDQVEKDGTPTPSWVQVVLAEYDKVKAAWLAAGLDIVPCHNDPGMGNYMRCSDGSGKPMKLIDWDYASNNERAYEIAVFVGFNFFDTEQTRNAIESYAGHWDEHLATRVRIMRMVSDVKWGLWGLANACAWNGDFDYYKYGIWDLRRAQIEMLRPGWSDQLRRL